jgi:hypothetical protein
MGYSFGVGKLSLKLRCGLALRLQVLEPCHWELYYSEMICRIYTYADIAFCSVGAVKKTFVEVAL